MIDAASAFNALRLHHLCIGGYVDCNDLEVLNALTTAFTFVFLGIVISLGASTIRQSSQRS
jgi:hypothetical protein